MQSTQSVLLLENRLKSFLIKDYGEKTLIANGLLSLEMKDSPNPFLEAKARHIQTGSQAQEPQQQEILGME